MSHAIPPAAPLSYEVAPPPRGRFSWLVFICAACVVGFAAMILLFVTPTVERVFQDFKLELPTPTRIFLMLSRLFVEGGWIAGCLVPPALGFLAPALTRHRQTWDAADYARAFNRIMAIMIVLLSILVLIVLTYIVLMLPMISLIQGISSQASPQPSPTPAVSPTGN